MLILALDTCLQACSVALYDAAAARLRAARFETMEKGHAEAAAPMLEACFRDAAVSPQDVNRIAVTVGPGSFTGVRIGLALAHGFAASVGCASVGLDSLQATAAPLFAAGHGSVLVVHNAGATGKFYAGVATPEKPMQAALLSAEDCRVLAPPGTPLIGTGADAIGDNHFMRIKGHDLPRAQDFAALAAALPAHMDPPPPLYLREPDAKPSAHAVPVLVPREATPEDIPSLARLHAMCFATPWSAESFASALCLPGASALALECDGALRAFVQYQRVADEAEVHMLCCEPRWRGRGFARRLLAALVDRLRAEGVQTLHLDVAEDNVAAVSLYGKAGFSVTGRRKGYYAREKGGPVDAVLMSRRP